MSPGYSQNSFGHVKAFEERDIQQFLNGSNAKKEEQKKKKKIPFGEKIRLAARKKIYFWQNDVQN